MLSSQYLGFFAHNNQGRRPKKLRACYVELQDRERACSTPTVRNSFGFLPQGYCERKNPKSRKDNI